MMLYLYVLQNQWIVLSLLGGTILTLLLCLTYQALWVPRGTEKESERIKVKDLRSFFVWIKSFVPWTITLLILASLTFTIVEIFRNYAIPPNW
jgi:type II secretory pathway component PulM